MPSNRQTGSTPFPPAENGRLTGWTATIGTDTSLAVYYGPLVPVDGETTKGTVNRMVDEAIAQTTAVSAQHNHDTQLIKRTDTTFQGYPAVVYDALGRRHQRRLRLPEGDHLREGRHHLHARLELDLQGPSRSGTGSPARSSSPPDPAAAWADP